MIWNTFREDFAEFIINAGSDGRRKMAYKDHAEATREYYRKQGEEREKLRILTLLEMLETKTPGAAWSPVYIKKLVNREA